MKHTFFTGGLTLSLTLALAACGGGGDDGGSDAPAPDVPDTIQTAGRLAIAEDQATALRMYDLDRGSVLSTFALASSPSGLYASPGRRYVLAFQRAQDTVQLADGGLWQEDHGDHLHDYQKTPAMLAFRITGPQPTHYDDRAGQASIFMDGRDPAVSSALVFNDADIAAGRVGASLNLETAMHGFAEPNGNFLVATYRAPGTASPTQVEVYRRQGTQYTLERRMDTQCPGMHGSFTRGPFTATGCADGVMVVSVQAGGEAVSSKIATPTGVGTIAGHPAVSGVIGIGNSGTPSTTRFYDVNLEAGTAAPIVIDGWAEGRLRRAHGFDRSGKHFFVLDDQGTLHVLARDASGWHTIKAIAGAVPAMPAAAPFPALVANEAKDEVYLSDPTARQLVVVDSAAHAVLRRLNLDFRPSYLAWVGIPR